jgi:hypothetical protein
MEVTNAQQYAADKVVEAARLLGQRLREAEAEGVSSDVHVADEGSDTRVTARCYVREERTLRSTREDASR